MNKKTVISVLCVLLLVLFASCIIDIEDKYHESIVYSGSDLSEKRLTWLAQNDLNYSFEYRIIDERFHDKYKDKNEWVKVKVTVKDGKNTAIDILDSSNGNNQDYFANKGWIFETMSDFYSFISDNGIKANNDLYQGKCKKIEVYHEARRDNGLYHNIVFYRYGYYETYSYYDKFLTLQIKNYIAN